MMYNGHGFVIGRYGRRVNTLGYDYKKMLETDLVEEYGKKLKKI